MNGTSTETVEGRVVGANPKGIKVSGSDAWLNYSRFAEVPHPTNGQLVRVDVGGDGFIRKLAILDGIEASAPNSGSAAPDQLTMRLRVLEIAANTVGRFAQCREQVKTSDVFPLADRMLAWLLEVDSTARHTIEGLEA
jgi:hypothetical protein